MKFICVCARVFVFFLLLSFASQTRADVIVNNIGQSTAGFFGPIGDDADNSDFLVGQEFTFSPGPSPYQLSAITLLLSTSGSGGNITVSLWDVDGNNNPSNEIAALPSVKVSRTGAVSFVPTNTIIVEPGMYYVVASPTTPADSGLVNWEYTASVNWSGDGTLNNFAVNNTGHWTNSAANQIPQISLVANTVTASLGGISHKTNVTTLTWPSMLGGFVADSTTNLVKPVWQLITNMVAVNGSTNSVMSNWSGPVQFYRLRQSWVANNLTQPGAGLNGPIGNDNTFNGYLIGQEFSLPVGKYSLNKVTLGLAPIQGSGHITVSIWSVDGNGNPGTVLAIVATNLVSSAGDFDFVPSTAVTLTNGNYYVVVDPTTPAENDMVGWYFTQSLGWTGFSTIGSVAATFEGGWDNFSFGSFDPMQMSVQVSPSP